MTPEPLNHLLGHVQTAFRADIFSSLPGHRALEISQIHVSLITPHRGTYSLCVLSGFTAAHKWRWLWGIFGIKKWRAKTSIQEVRRGGNSELLLWKAGFGVNMYNLGRTVDEWLLPRSSCQKYLRLKCRVRGEGRGRPAVSKCFCWFENISSNQATPAPSLTVYQPSAKIWQKSFSENRHKLFLAKQEVEVTSAAVTDF